MKKLRRYLGLTLAILLPVMLLTACGDDITDDNYTEEDTTVTTVEEPTVPAPPNEGGATSLIPVDCLVDEDAFNTCLDEGLIPEDCFDDEGYLLDIIPIR